MELYQEQHRNGFYFLHEHPFNASSLENEEVKKVMNLNGVVKVKSHMCAFGMTEGEELVKKPTGLMTNAIKICENLKRDCSGDHRHVVFNWRRTCQESRSLPWRTVQANRIWIKGSDDL